ncbi:MAG: hypothetical protein QF921_01325 [Pseudomonadales bacterium]|nr:hypothetical protein [Pseudomonadales bacterium]MDP6472169.1 hypothetical protein [Pseudomonadales bacterium]MDP6826579.1 hypothetical protein [Pseudomonadales bacterium]MDP6970150.1 hypothetical protein [Pseudomonadales bacterium]
MLKASFATGYLLTQYADRYNVFGIDYNATMVITTQHNLAKRAQHAEL